MSKSKVKAVLFWSGGKDAALALHQVQQQKKYNIVALVTTMVRDTLQSSVHELPKHLLEQQALSMGLPWRPLFVGPALEGYHEALKECASYFAQQDVSHWIFGDLYADEIALYRKQMLTSLGVHYVAPLAQLSQKEILQLFYRSALQATIIVVQKGVLTKGWLGQVLSSEVMEVYPDQNDVFGESGAYHTFVFDGPMFQFRIHYQCTTIKTKTYRLTNKEGVTNDYFFWQAQLK